MLHQYRHAKVLYSEGPSVSPYPGCTRRGSGIRRCTCASRVLLRRVVGRGCSERIPSSKILRVLGQRRGRASRHRGPQADEGQQACGGRPLCGLCLDYSPDPATASLLNLRMSLGFSKAQLLYGHPRTLKSERQSFNDMQRVTHISGPNGS